MRIMVLVATACCLLASAAQAEDRRPRARFVITSVTLATLASIDIAQSIPCLRSTTCGEANPIYKRTSVPGFIAIKAGGIGAITAAAWSMRTSHPRRAWFVLGVTTAVQGFVVAHNARVLARR